MEHPIIYNVFRDINVSILCKPIENVLSYRSVNSSHRVNANGVIRCMEQLNERLGASSLMQGKT